MTLEQFDKTSFGASMKCIYKGKERLIGGVEFEERLIGLVNECDEDDRDWVRCENIKLI
ncbi:hypothetical protein [Psychromonas sp. MME2]|uniref:hypothetical protein n=1 Tax=unclassified Psychromonas TaxID=2614957 RepID=UPI00339C87D7